MKCPLRVLFASLFVALSAASASAQAPEIRTGLSGRWVINDNLSDNTDDRVEEAIEAGGGEGSRGFFNRHEDFYRGGPPEHELYDHISYEDVIIIEVNEPELRFTYGENFQRVFHSDGRRRRASATGFYSEGGTDFSSGLFEGNSLVVEGRPRDGGFTIEIYSLESDGNRLRIEMTIQPDSFREPIELVRYFDRAE